MIEHLKPHANLLHKKIEAHYYRGRSIYYKGTTNEDQGSITNDLADFEVVLCFRIPKETDKMLPLEHVRVATLRSTFNLYLN